MFVSQFLLATVKETPAEAEVISHQLMLRAGMIRKLASGLYSWLPLGLRVLRKVEKIVREEMNRAGAVEILMPMVQPAELWQETERWEKFGTDLLKIKDRHERDFCLGPTHEEIITDLFRREIHSYKQLPINLYQIQLKFRDEIRPRFGVMRAREFLMKDAYSFHMDDASLQQTYQAMYDAYTRIFTRVGLKFRPVLAETGAMGGRYSHEFQALTAVGEDTVVYSDSSDYAANLERAEALPPEMKRAASATAMSKIATPGLKTIKALEEALKIPAQKSVKTLIVKGSETPIVALILRGDHELNENKAAKFPEIAQPLVMVDENIIRTQLNCGPGSLGPVNLKIPFIVDRDAAVLVDFTCGANEEGFHFTHVNWERDVSLGKIGDLRNVVEGDKSPDGKGTLKFTRGIEVGQVFQLGDRYCRQMNATVTDESGKPVIPKMGCYGIGVSRVVAAVIEQHHDDNGIIWPQAIAPFDVAIIPMQYHRSHRVREMVQKIYQQLQNAGFEVLVDDRNERPGVMFADMDLIGIPHRLVISERGMDAGTIEYKSRSSAEVMHWPMDQVIQMLSPLRSTSKI